MLANTCSPIYRQLRASLPGWAERRIRPATTDRRRPADVNVLVVIARSDPAASWMLSGLKGYCALVCEDSAGSLEAVSRGFQPDVAVIDTRLPDAVELAGRIRDAGVGRGTILVALCQSGEARPAGFSHRMVFNSSASEVAELLVAVADSNSTSLLRCLRATAGM